METVVIDGVLFEKAKDANDMSYVIVRTRSAGAFAGYMESRNGLEGYF